jgi:hypothetical protein
MSKNTFEASFVGLDLSEFHYSSHFIRDDDVNGAYAALRNGEANATTTTTTSASEKLRCILAQEMEQKLKDTIESKQMADQAKIHAEKRLEKIVQIRQTREGHISEHPSTSWLEHDHDGKDFLGGGGGLYSTLVSMHKGDDNGARKVVPRHSNVTKVHRKKQINVKAKIRR